MEGGGETKIAAEKIGKVCRTLKKRLKCGRDTSPSQVDRHQAARCSRSIKANIAKQNPFSFAGTKNIQRSSSGAGSSLQNLVFQKTRSRKSRFKQKPIFSITTSWPSLRCVHTRRHERRQHIGAWPGGKSCSAYASNVIAST